MTQMYRCTPRQAYSHMVNIIEAGLVPNLISSPGLGKSSLYRKLARQFNLSLIDHRLSTSAPEDLSGLPEFVTRDQGTPHERRVASFTPFDLFPTDRTPIPDPYAGWLLFFDEFNSGEKEIQAACYKIILDKFVGQFPLHKRVAMGCAGNLMTDKAITNELSTAMQSRVITIEMMLSFEDWLRDVALAEDYDDRIVAYINYDNDALYDFRPDHQDKTFCCPRTWEFMNKLIMGREVTDDKTSLYAGTISSGYAAAFVQFCQIYKEIMTIADVLRDPSGAPTPDRNEKNKCWALTSHLLKKTDKENFTDVATYINRMELSFRILYFRGLMAQKPQLRQHPAYAKAMLELQQYLKDD